MADIKQFQIDGITYPVKDVEARDWISNAIDLFYPVGSIIINLGTDPSTYLEGTTWVRTAVGQAIVGVDANSTIDAFTDATEESYGYADSIVPSHIHTGTAQSAGAHIHGMKSVWSDGSGSSLAYTMASNRKAVVRETASAGAHTHSLTVDSTGVSATNKNYQPSMAFYIWKRIA